MKTRSLPRAFAQEASDSISIEVITTFDYPGDVTQTVPSGINDRDDITGYYVDSNGVTRGFVRFTNGTFSAPIVELHGAAGPGSRLFFFSQGSIRSSRGTGAVTKRGVPPRGTNWAITPNRSLASAFTPTQTPKPPQHFFSRNP